MLQCCSHCKSWGLPYRERCANCLAGDLGWKRSGGKGTLYSFTLMHKVLHPGFASSIPYNISQIDLDENVRITSSVIDTNDLTIGCRLEVVFVNASDDVIVPRFRLI